MRQQTNIQNLSPNHPEVKKKKPLNKRGAIKFLGARFYHSTKHRRFWNNFNNPVLFLGNPGAALASMSKGTRLGLNIAIEYGMRNRRGRFKFCQATLARRIGRSREWVNQFILPQLEKWGLLKVWYNEWRANKYLVSPIFFKEKFIAMLAPYLRVLRTHNDILKNLTPIEEEKTKELYNNTKSLSRGGESPEVRNKGDGMESFNDICDKVVQNVESRTQKPNSSASNSYGKSHVPNYGRPSLPKGYRSESSEEREARRREELRRKYSSYDESSC